MHPRAQIRAYVVALLKAANITADRVYPSRFKPFSCRDLPAIGVYALGDDPDHKDSSPRTYVREMSLVVEAVAQVDDKLDDELDALAEAIEDVMLIDPALGGLAWDTILGPTHLGLAESGSTQFGSARITFLVTHATTPPEPTLSDLETIAGQWDMAAPDGVTEMESLVQFDTDAGDGDQT